MDISSFKVLTLEDRSIFIKYFHQNPPQISEYTFTNFIMWQHVYRFIWKEIHDNLILISTKDSKKRIIFPPIGKNPDSILSDLQKLMKNTSADFIWEFHRIPETYIEFMKKTFPTSQIIDDRDNYDYVYSRIDLTNLSGKNFENDRKKLNKFKSRYKWKYVPLNKEQIQNCLDLQDEWCQLRSCSDNPSLANEDYGIKQILLHWDKLQFSGGVIWVEDKIVAFTLAEPLNPNTYVIHVEKANTEYIGAYQAINQIFAENIDAQFELINREQDLGEPNLRRAKENYKPISYIKKYQFTNIKFDF